MQVHYPWCGLAGLGLGAAGDTDEVHDAVGALLDPQYLGRNHRRRPVGAHHAVSLDDAGDGFFPIPPPRRPRAAKRAVGWSPLSTPLWTPPFIDH